MSPRNRLVAPHEGGVNKWLDSCYSQPRFVDLVMNSGSKMTFTATSLDWMKVASILPSLNASPRAAGAGVGGMKRFNEAV